MHGLCRASNLLLKGCDWKTDNGKKNKKVVACKDIWVHGEIQEYKSEVRLCNVRNWKASHFILPQHIGWNHRRVLESFVFHDVHRIVGMELPTEEK